MFAAAYISVCLLLDASRLRCLTHRAPTAARGQGRSRASSLTAPPSFPQTLGNHDYLGHVQAQIDYTNKSSRWNLPSHYYSKSYDVGRGADGRMYTMDIIYIDTVVLAGNSDLQEDPYAPLEGPADPLLAQTQWDWIEEHLKNSKADYLFTAGHYPVWSGAFLSLFSSLLSFIYLPRLVSFPPSPDRLCLPLPLTHTHSILLRAGQLFPPSRLPARPDPAAGDQPAAHARKVQRHRPPRRARPLPRAH